VITPRPPALTLTAALLSAALPWGHRPRPVPAGGEANLVRDPVAFLQRVGGLTPADLASLERGSIIAKVIDSGDRSEVFSLAVMRVKTTPARALTRLREFEGRRGAPWILQSGRVGSAPSAGDFAAMTLDAGDVKHLGKCVVNACELRLPAEQIERFRREVDWSSDTRIDRANALFRQMLASYAAGYLKGGNTALFKYDNNDDPVRIADSLHILVPRFEVLRDTAPDLHEYLEGFPEGRPEDAEEILYWTKERFWLVNVLSMSHSTVCDRTTPSGRLVLAVSKQLYANHYYESSVGATFFVEGASGWGPHVVYVNRTRADIRRNGFTWVERTLLKFLVKDRLEAQSKYLRQQLETP
jgi:hypothetical protein